MTSAMTVMDLGAGTGLIAARVAACVDEVVAVDISPSMLEALAATPELHGKVSVVCRDHLEARSPITLT